MSVRFEMISRSSMCLLLSRLREIHSIPGSDFGRTRAIGGNSVCNQQQPNGSRTEGALLIDRNLVDPASSHMLVSKIKPCMSQYKSSHGETANGSLKQL